MRKRAKKNHHRQFIFFSASGLIAVIVCIMLNVFPVSADSTHSQTGSVYYTSIEIQPGDTLWNIAEETMTSEYSSVPEYVKVLKEINSLDSDQLEAGQNLIYTLCIDIYTLPEPGEASLILRDIPMLHLK